ncbi:hypothetical protein CVV38_04290 [Candidatus Peregrinibacteria bacterium HGW-Peregrinibacteria-1]|jgi:tetratricopeptide (TPR) repeat protein|nr:MAG: hypothetical protein CVV38_04290 [Candidatus Peregrinibacteria bacterium HGW-Peregrinibacteria-1]
MPHYDNSGQDDRVYTLNPLIEEADLLKSDGKHQEAILLCEQILKTDLECVEAFEEIGDNYLSLREYGKAEKALIQAIKLNTNSANAHYLLGFVYSCTGQWSSSVALLETANDLYPNHPEILRCLGWSLYHHGERPKGIILLERSHQLASSDPLILNDLGVCYLNEKNFEKAGHLFKKALQFDPTNNKAKECLNAVNFFRREFDKMKKQ